MGMKEGLLQEFEHEAASTRKVLERVPEDKFGWKPHAKSGTMIWLAGHIAQMGMWGAMTLNTPELDIMPGGKQMEPPPPPKTSKELVAMFDANVQSTREALQKATDDDLKQPWSLLVNGKAQFTMPKIAVLRGMVMNHMIHHRGQLTVYLRLNDVPVPALYGPSADENGGFAG